MVAKSHSAHEVGSGKCSELTTAARKYEKKKANASNNLLIEHHVALQRYYGFVEGRSTSDHHTKWKIKSLKIRVAADTSRE